MGLEQWKMLDEMVLWMERERKEGKKQRVKFSPDEILEACFLQTRLP